MAETETMTVICKTCGMPVRVDVRGGEIVRVLAVCGHPTQIDEAKGPTSSATR